MPLRYGWGAKKPILAIFCTWTSRLGAKLCPYELIFHEHIEENSTDHLGFIKKNYQVDLKKFERLDFWPSSRAHMDIV